MRYPIIRIGKDSDPELDGTSFVGVSKFDNSNEIPIVVPYGVEIDDVISDSDATQKEQYSFLRRYVKAVQKALSSHLTKERLEEKTGIHNPIAAVNLLHDYLSMGKLIEYDTISAISEKGKVDFNLTIKRIKPKIVKNGFYYEHFITKKRSALEDGFVSEVQCNIINHFMQHGGQVLFGQSLSLPIRNIDFSDPSVLVSTISRLRKEISNTFNSRKETIIRWSLLYLEGLRNLNRAEKADGNWQYAIIASTLWEVMIESVLGNQSERDKTQYGTAYQFTNIRNGSKSKPGRQTQHDTIYEDDETLIIIDAKMYGSPLDLLSEKILGKQFGYYEQAKLVKSFAHEQKNIINILILPHIPGFDSPYFQTRIVLDPHTSVREDPYKIIFLYEYPANELIDDFYYGRKKSSFLIYQFKCLIQDPGVQSFLERQGCKYSFKEMPEVNPYEAWKCLDEPDRDSLFILRGNSFAK
jgi:hypothetical protein